MKATSRASLILAFPAIALLIVLSSCAGGPTDYADRVEIRRTSFGVPHILAEDLGSMAFGLAWAHMEDYGHLVVERLTMVRGLNRRRAIGLRSWKSYTSHPSRPVDTATDRAAIRPATVRKMARARRREGALAG